MADVKMQRTWVRIDHHGHSVGLSTNPERVDVNRKYNTENWIEVMPCTPLTDAAPALLEALKGYEQWEANLICEDHANEANGKHVVSAAMWQELLDLQTKRNAAIAQARGEVV